MLLLADLNKPASLWEEWGGLLICGGMAALILIGSVGVYLLHKAESAGTLTIAGKALISWIDRGIDRLKSALSDSGTPLPRDSVSVGALCVKALIVTILILPFLILVAGEDGDGLTMLVALCYLIIPGGYLAVQAIQLVKWMSPEKKVPVVWPSLRKLELRRGWKTRLILAPILVIEVIALYAMQGSGPMAGTKAFVRSYVVGDESESSASDAEARVKRELRKSGYTIVGDGSEADVHAEVAVYPNKSIRHVRLVDAANNTVICIVSANSNTYDSSASWWERDVFVAVRGSDGGLHSPLRQFVLVDPAAPRTRGRSAALDYGAYRPNLGKPQRRVYVDIEPNQSWDDDYKVYAYGHRWKALSIAASSPRAMTSRSNARQPMSSYTPATGSNGEHRTESRSSRLRCPSFR